MGKDIFFKHHKVGQCKYAVVKIKLLYTIYPLPSNGDFKWSLFNYIYGVNDNDIRQLSAPGTLVVQRSVFWYLDTEGSSLCDTCII